MPKKATLSPYEINKKKISIPFVLNFNVVLILIIKCTKILKKHLDSPTKPGVKLQIDLSMLKIYLTELYSSFNL